MSAKIFVFSDTHFGHENMAKHRGFSSAKEQDDYIVDKWNSVVRECDTVYLLGDITMEKANYEILNRLKGFKKVVLGNHDHHVKRLLEYVNSVRGSVGIKGVILTHIPIHDSEMGRYKYNIHGHVHSNTLNDKRYINVSAEVVDYTPQVLNDLIL